MTGITEKDIENEPEQRNSKKETQNRSVSPSFLSPVMFPNKADELFFRQGMREKESLQVIAAAFTKHMPHFRCFNAFNDRFFANAPDGAQGGLQEGHRGRILHRLPEDAPVKFHQTDRIGQQGSDGRKAGTIIIEAEYNAFRPHTLHEGDEIIRSFSACVISAVSVISRLMASAERP